MGFVQRIREEYAEGGLRYIIKEKVRKARDKLDRPLEKVIDKSEILLAKLVLLILIGVVFILKIYKHGSSYLQGQES